MHFDFLVIKKFSLLAERAFKKHNKNLRISSLAKISILFRCYSKTIIILHDLSSFNISKIKNIFFSMLISILKILV